jgi:hypothetical protein
VRNNINTTQSRQYLNWQLNCPAQIQPNALIDFRIRRDKSCKSDSGNQAVLLPEGYRYCWHHKSDSSKNDQSDSTARVLSNGPRNGIIVNWKVAPGGFPCPVFGRGWIDHLWFVTGARVGAECPPK